MVPCALIRTDVNGHPSALEIIMNARRVMRVQPPCLLGDVTVAPAALTGRAEADMAQAMAAALKEG